jgi:mono/diheme cytochrome c family protein
MRVLLPTILVCLLLSAAALGAEADGAKLYQNHCSACHGMRGEGDGPIAMLMTVTVPNLRELAKHNDGVFPTDRVTAYVDGRGPAQAHGGRQMPVWGDVFSAATKADEPVVAANVKVLVQFIEELQQR